MEADERRRRIREWLAARPTRPAPIEHSRAAELRELSPAELDGVGYRRRWLPHWELPGATYFVTFRVAHAIGRPFSARDAASRPPGPGVVMEEVILFGLHSRYEIDAYVVMPDHVHLLVTPRADVSLPKVLHSLKGYSAWRLNGLAGRRGQFWQDESFDHLIRGEADWLDKREYILQNPVAAGLAASATEYPLSSAVTLDPPGRREELSRLLSESSEAQGGPSGSALTGS